MARKKQKQKEYVKVVGTPTMLMLPARNYKFQVDTTEYVLTIPRKGKYMDLEPELFTEEDGEFEILSKIEEENNTQVLYMPSLTKVLFAVGTYPDLKEGQAFTPIAIIVRDDEVDIVGNIIDMLKEEE